MKGFMVYSMTKNKSFAVISACLIILIFSAFLSLCLGAADLSPAQIVQGIFEGDSSSSGRILLHVRLPRLFAAALSGTGLAVSGVIIQTVLNNPLASPGILGVNAGAGLFTAIFAVFLPYAVMLLPLAAFIGALATVLSVYGIAKKAGLSKITLILSGVAIGSLMTAGINTITALFPDVLIGMHDFQTGGFTGVTPQILFPAGILILIGTLAATLLGGELDVLGLGESTALSLGLNVRFYRFLFLMLAAALAGAAVSFSGLLGFIGLIVPHITRMLIKGSRRLILFTSALIGASFLILCDTIARTVFAPFELPVGILVSFFGVPFFLWILFRERRHRNA
ncbi:iron complex transport system permease protein [Ruminiclostridium sufflavum DSM 19573]|uniref:Iron complex transport system permease protein n=1 Tax=Ruminiclostridium sufflavum DSM 19573 TaxID=1121337 RepID=A0A318XG10_9FIRM|nr:iron ABC transporter permease [Ruminiclostridium sufflavum]PYG84857.1 iron complex transport system permease protein [Ruminiclostridium sufflavum DSM 19573]